MRLAALVVLASCARAATPVPCPPDEVIGALHDAAFQLEHGADAAADLERAARGPLDATARSMLQRLQHAAMAGGDATAVTEQIRAELADWRCLGEEQHRRLHAALGRPLVEAARLPQLFDEARDHARVIVALSPT